MRTNQRGFNLVEVLVSVVLLALIGYGMVKIYFSIVDGRRVRSAMGDIQMRGQLVLSTLNRYIRQAGDASCLQNVDPDLHSKSVIGYNALTVPKSFGFKPLQQTDVIVVGECAPVDGQLQYGYYAFYVAKTNRVSALGQPIPAFYKKRLGGKRVEIVTGVDGLRFGYGIQKSSSSDIDQYTDAFGVKDWAQVKSIQIALSLESTDPAMQSIQGSRFYRVWHSYVTLQNRLPVK